MPVAFFHALSSAGETHQNCLETITRLTSLKRILNIIQFGAGRIMIIAQKTLVAILGMILVASCSAGSQSGGEQQADRGREANGADLSGNGPAAATQNSAPLPVFSTMINALDLDRVGNGPSPWTSLEALDAASKFHFVVISDRTGGHRDGVWADAMDKINLTRPAFVVSVGDLIEGYTEDLEQLENEWSELEGMVGTLKPPFFYTPGNHDYSNDVMADLWEQKFGPSYYSFEYKNTLFVVLNSSLMDPESEASDWAAARDWTAEQAEQMTWLADTLEAHDNVRWTYLFMHHPYWRDTWWRRFDQLSWTDRAGPPEGDTGPAEWDHVADLLKNRNYTAFAGHTHNYEYEADDSGPHVHERISLATTGGTSTLGSGSELAGAELAEFDHFVWVTMTDEGPVIANLLLEGILPKDFDHFFKQPPLNATDAE